MTDIRVFKGRDETTVKMSGHAGDERVCSALSALFCTLIYALEGRAELSHKISGGNAEACFKNSEFADEAAAVVADGFELIAKKYPAYASFTLTTEE